MFLLAQFASHPQEAILACAQEGRAFGDLGADAMGGGLGVNWDQWILGSYQVLVQEGVLFKPKNTVW